MKCLFSLLVVFFKFFIVCNINLIFVCVFKNKCVVCKCLLMFEMNDLIFLMVFFCFLKYWVLYMDVGME